LYQLGAHSVDFPTLRLDKSLQIGLIPHTSHLPIISLIVLTFPECRVLRSTSAENQVGVRLSDIGHWSAPCFLLHTVADLVLYPR
jgi:hypothetical protein